MDFLKPLFPNGGALTFEQLAEKAKEQKLNVVNLAAGGYISADKFNDKMNGLTQQVSDFQGQIAKRDTDLATLKDQLTTAQADAGKLGAVQQSLTDLQTRYNTDKTTYEQKMIQQSYEFAVREKANGLKFSSVSARKTFIQDAINKGFKMDGESLLGYDDFVTKYKADDPGAFAVDAPAEPTPPAPTKPTIVLPVGGKPPVGARPKLSDLMKAKNDNPETVISFDA